MELKPRKDRYSPDNVYRIYLPVDRHPGTKWVSFKDKATGLVTKGVFIPDTETGMIRISKGNIIFAIKAVPVKGCMETHILLPDVWRGVDCGLGRDKVDFRKAIIGKMYVVGEVLGEDQKRIINEFAKRKKLKIGRYKKD